MNTRPSVSSSRRETKRSNRPTRIERRERTRKEKWLVRILWKFPKNQK
jgi:hypothetical protein